MQNTMISLICQLATRNLATFGLFAAQTVTDYILPNLVIHKLEQYFEPSIVFTGCFYI